MMVESTNRYLVQTFQLTSGEWSTMVSIVLTGRDSQLSDEALDARFKALLGPDIRATFAGSIRTPLQGAVAALGYLLSVSGLTEGEARMAHALVARRLSRVVAEEPHPKLGRGSLEGRLGRLMQQRGVSRRELARRADVSLTTIAKLERGRLPAGRLLLKLSEELGVDLYELLGADTMEELFELGLDPSLIPMPEKPNE